MKDAKDEDGEEERGKGSKGAKRVRLKSNMTKEREVRGTSEEELEKERNKKE